MGNLTDNSGKAGDPAKGKVVWEFEKIDSYNHDPDTDCDSSIFSGCAPEWIFDFFHDERIDLLFNTLVHSKYAF